MHQSHKRQSPKQEPPSRWFPSDRGKAIIEPLESRQLLSVSAPSLAGSYSSSSAAAGAVTVADTATVGTSPTTTSLTVSSINTVINVPVTYTATVTPVVGGATPTGYITFNYNYSLTDYSSQIVPLQSNGTATFTISASALAYINVTAVYSGDANNAASSSIDTAANANTGPATLAISRGNIPDAILTNAPTRGVMDVLVTNPTSFAIRDTETVNMYMLGLDAGSTAIPIGSVKRRVNIPAGHTLKVPVPVKLQPGDGTPEYSQFTAVSVGSAGQASLAFGVFIDIAAPYVALSVSSSPFHPAIFSVKKSVWTYTVTVTDTGNVDAVGSIDMSATVFNATTTPLPFGTGVFRAHIKAGKSEKFVIHGKYLGAGTFPVGVFNEDITATLNGVTGTGESDDVFTVL